MPVKTIIQLRRDTLANWSTSQDKLGYGVLYAGELGVELDSDRLKVGDGVNHWNDLPYISASGAGAQGVQGVQGIQGASNGPQGIQGLIGAQGVQGIQGIIGFSGSQGVQGITGGLGSQGIQGLSGSSGSQGSQGITGGNGSQGIQGITGSDGSQGAQGIDGNSGSQGIQGITGFSGSQGVQGIQGTLGFQGIQGVIGSGVQGIQGIIGPAGSGAVAGSGTQYYVPLWDSSTDLTDSIIYQSGLNIGIGTTNVTHKLTVNGNFSATSKSFEIPHPSKKRGTLVYGSLESPYHGVRLTGSGSTRNGKAVVRLPKYIRDLVKEDGITVQLTNYRHSKVLYVDQIDLPKNTIIIRVTDPQKGEELEFFWDFTAIRKDIPDLIVEP